MRAAPLAALALLLGAPAVSQAASEPWLRVIAPEATVRSGPGERFRPVYRAARGEVLRVLDRATLGYWFRVALPDGTSGWLLGDATVPFEVDVEGRPRRARWWERARDRVFAPSPLLHARVGFSFSGGALGGDGMFMVRPSVIVDDHLALEARVGEAIGRDGSQVHYGLDADVLIWPEGPFVPFVALGGGGATSFPKVNGVAQASATDWALDAGGGLLIVVRWRIVLRFDVRNYTLFTPNRTTNRQEYSGGLAVYF
jgi:hypothetical protein